MSDVPCHYLHFGLIVTGKAERKHLPKLFKSLMEAGICHFKVVRFIGQRDPITSPRRKLEMIGSGQKIPDKDATDIGFPARRFLRSSDCSLVILIDDLEHDRREEAQQVFDRYRLALDTILTAEQGIRSAVHFLVNMLEAYYFADVEAVNATLGLDPPLEDYVGDVEAIRNPKSDLKDLYSGFNEIKDGGRILDSLSVPHVLSQPDRCAWLRTLFAWCVKVLESYSPYQLSHLRDEYSLRDGVLSRITGPQLAAFGIEEDEDAN
jgi:hypothetical protein